MNDVAGNDFRQDDFLIFPVAQYGGVNGNLPTESGGRLIGTVFVEKLQQRAE